MKKLIPCTLILVFAFILVSCNGNDTGILAQETEISITYEHEQEEVVSEFDIQILEDFLIGFPEIFRHEHKPYDIYGNFVSITADEFTLYDFDEGGMPAVAISFTSWQGHDFWMSGFRDIYIFYDGAFYNVGFGWLTEFHRGDDGQHYIISFEKGDWYTVYRLNGLEIERVLSAGYSEYEIWRNATRTTELQTLTDLQNQMTELITERLGDWIFSGKPLENRGGLEWQWAYVDLLNYYSLKPLGEMEYGWRFILHDIDHNGIPELFLVIGYQSGHQSHRAIYTFADGSIISLPFDFGGAIDGGSLTFWDDNPQTFLFGAVGSGGTFTPITMEDNRITSGDFAFFGLNDQGHARAWEEPDLYWLDWDYHDLWIAGEPSTTEEFEAAFGGWGENRWLNAVAITDDNIKQIIFTQN
ncbi:MAG: hypothetical protein FWB98_04065 [Defluviitaleaceae bacterium]|nr:hypothetical protein [Defluviitaleaceae bacterium]